MKPAFSLLSTAKSSQLQHFGRLTKGYYKYRVTSLEQLSLAEFSGEKARPKVYENGLKNVLAIWLDLELKVKNIKN